MLHRMAATFDKAPTPERRRDVERFFSLLGDLYPCEQCAAHFRGMLAEHPIDSTNNKALSLWLCRVHNVVNARLGKTEFPCTLDALKQAYGKCGCFDDPVANATAATAAVVAAG
jgi:FAD-linked sulfhydryl oxidase